MSKRPEGMEWSCEGEQWEIGQEVMGRPITVKTSYMLVGWRPLEGFEHRSDRI